MKTFVKILGTTIFIPLFLIALVSGTMKFMILHDSFWIDTFEKHNVYSDIKIVINSYLDSKNANLFREIVTIDNIKLTTDKNVKNVINFANGKSQDLIFYIPVTKIPKEMLPKKMGTLKEEMSAKEIIQKFNIGGIDPVIFDQLKVLGKFINYIFIVSLLLTLVIALISYPFIIVILGVALFIQRFIPITDQLSTNKLFEGILKSLIIEISYDWSVLGILLTLLSILIYLTQFILRRRRVNG